jgi:hypothetical protein
MAATKKHRAAYSFAMAQAFYKQAMMHRTLALATLNPSCRYDRWTRARHCLDRARYYTTQCGAILGINNWPK